MTFPSSVYICLFDAVQRPCRASKRLTRLNGTPGRSFRFLASKWTRGSVTTTRCIRARPAPIRPSSRPRCRTTSNSPSNSTTIIPSSSSPRRPRRSSTTIIRVTSRPRRPRPRPRLSPRRPTIAKTRRTARRSASLWCTARRRASRPALPPSHRPTFTLPLTTWSWGRLVHGGRLCPRRGPSLRGKYII